MSYLPEARLDCRGLSSAFSIGDAERDEWMMCMRQALQDSGVSDEVKAMLDPAFLRMANAFRNR